MLRTLYSISQSFNPKSFNPLLMRLQPRSFDGTKRMEKVEFIEYFKSRTKKFVLNILELFRDLKPTQESIIIRKQLIRSAGSVAANYRAACRARSRAEFY